MNVCPNCRAGKECIEWEHTADHLIKPVIDYQCQRCGFEKRKRETL